MKKLLNLAMALMLTLMFVSTTKKALAQDPDPSACDAQLQQLIEDTQNNFCTCDPKDLEKSKKKLLKNLYKAQEYLMKGTVKDQYKAAKEVWNYDWELRKMWLKNTIPCDRGAELDESALQLLICIVDLYYPNSGYDPYENGVISCDP